MTDISQERKGFLCTFLEKSLILSLPKENEKDLSDNFMAFPNPSSGNFNIRLNINPELIELVDLTGKTIPFSTSYQAEILSIDAGSIAPGMYVLKIRTGQNSPITFQSIIISR